ncbi:aluminum-activated malate transporter 9-like [Tripterygium wilfordii]|uniref:Aluminum-activated malate transporter 9-like n=1 Tax=Tripterygium wilfordii TaxID=458696 RepID=A0A7J7CJI8_TRIWF|nr:aluminum-activated malate transporter 9-like [Tripterygium wilfordii]KAF5734220.1 aluminum-activated malate transporter 9-like [Tripterygium wilfordii]
MHGKKGSIEINILPATKTKQPEFGKKFDNKALSCKAWIWSVWEFCKEDTNRVKFAFKVGIAVLLVSLLILVQAPYEIFGTNIIWSILTVAIMFEYTVGATFNRGFNRALGSLLAGILAIAVAQLALRSGRIAEPIIIGISIFFIGTITSFMKLWPSLVPYEYGFRVILFTFCLIIVSGYRMGNPIRTAMDRLYSIAIGGFVAVLVNVLVFPIWAGEQLHKELVKCFDSVADSLEECVKKYLEDDGLDHPEFSKTIMDEFPDEPAYQRCKTTLNSSAKLETLANSAKWEPPHGRFRHFFYPWSEYVKVVVVLRYCAYEVMALHGVLHSEIQAPFNLRITFQSEIQDATKQAAEIMRRLGKDIGDMKRSLKTSILKKVHSSTERLQRAIDMHSYLLTSNYDPHDNISKPLPSLSHTLSSNLYDLSNQSPDFDSNSVEKNLNPIAQNMPSGTLPPAQAESYHEMMRKQSRRLHSWPSREVDAFEEDGNLGTDFLPRMRALESTAALSLATFTSLLIEFVARLDHLVEAVDELSKKAKFKHENA